MHHVSFFGVRSSVRALGVLCPMLLISAPAAAQDSWAGKKIMPKEGAVEIRSGDEVIGKTASAVLTVLATERDWLQVRDHGVEGWIARKDVVLLDNAIEHFTDVIRENGRAGWAYQKRGTARRYQGDYDSAMEDFNEAIRLEPDSASAYDNRADGWFAQGDYDKAIADFSEAIHLRPEDPYSYSGRGLAWTNKSEYDKAIADFSEAIRLDPKDSSAYHDRGYAWHRKEDYDKAVADFSEAIRLWPQDVESFFWRGSAWRRKQEYEKALGDFHEAIRIDQQYARAYNERAWLWATCPDARYRDGRQAVESARRACELTDWKAPAYIDTLAAADAESGDFDEAVKMQMQAAELTAEDSKEDFQSRLALYRERKPYREEQPLPPVTPASVVKGNNEFAFDLYGRLRPQDGNLFFSPYSISTALAMTYGGSAGDTQTEMAQVLHFGQDPAALHTAFAEIVGRLQGVGTRRAYQLHVANALWAQHGYQFNPAYFGLVEDRYRAALKEVDFRQAPEEARAAINRWVEGQTGGKIKELLKPGIVNSTTPLVLTNAIYFKAAWSETFSPQQTKDEDFFTAQESRTKVPMMHQTETFRYFDGGRFQLLELPYKGDELSMLVILPQEVDGLAETENSLSAAALAQWIEKLERHIVDVSLPKFRTSAEFSLKGTLVDMGMKLAFDGDRADFSAMTADRNKLCIGAVEHQAFVDVDENGTEAAAATAVVMAPGAGAIPRDLKRAVFRADHPFVFVIRETATGSILFLGRVTKPGTTVE